MSNDNYEHGIKFILFLKGHWYNFHLQISGKWLDWKQISIKIVFTSKKLHHDEESVFKIYYSEDDWYGKTASGCRWTGLGTMWQLCTSTLMVKTHFSIVTDWSTTLLWNQHQIFFPWQTVLCFRNIHALSSSHSFFCFLVCLFA